jgi:membrane protein
VRRPRFAGWPSRLRRTPPLRTVLRRVRRPWVRRTLILLSRAVSEFREDHCPQLAAAIAFHVLFSTFPLLIVGVGIIGLITQDPHAREAVLRALIQALPLSGHGRQQLRQLLGSVGGSAGALGLLGVLGVLWSASGVMAAVRTALNIAWDTDAKRPFIRGKLVDLMLVGGTFVAVGATLGLTVAAAIVRRSAVRLPGTLHRLAPVTGALATAAVVVTSVLLLFATFAVVYRLVPAAPTRLRGIWPGALAAAVGLEALQYGFSAYVALFGHYNKVYGSLGAIVAFMFLVYVAGLVFLLGAEIASEYPRLRGWRDRPDRG